MKTLSDTDSIRVVVTNTDVAAGSDAVINLAANAVQRHVIDFVGGGFYAAPNTNTALVITDTTNNTILYQTPVTAAGPILLPWHVKGVPAPLGAAVEIKLEDGGQIKDLNIMYR